MRRSREERRRRRLLLLAVPDGPAVLDDELRIRRCGRLRRRRGTQTRDAADMCKHFFSFSTRSGLVRDRVSRQIFVDQHFSWLRFFLSRSNQLRQFFVVTSLKRSISISQLTALAAPSSDFESKINEG